MKFFKFAGSALALAFLSTTPASGAIIYNDFYENFNPASSRVKDGQDPGNDDVASWAYFAQQRNAWGGVVGFDGAATLDTFSVIMSNWNGWDPNGGPGTATSGYDTDLTLELYEVDRSGAAPAPGTQIVADTELQSIAGRQLPTATNASFVDGGGTDSVVDWDLGGLSVGSELLFMVQVDDLVGKEFGNPPANNALTSLNIASFVTGGTGPDVTAGSDTDQALYGRGIGDSGSVDINRFAGAGQVMAKAEGKLASVPEPSMLSLLLVGLGGLGLVALGKHKAA